MYEELSRKSVLADSLDSFFYIEKNLSLPPRFNLNVMPFPYT